MTYAIGIATALASPVAIYMGFMVLDNHWKGSAFAINMFKGCLSSVLFVIMGLARRPFTAEIFNLETVGYLCLSSTIGIILGDWTWFESLRFLGARRVILIDSLKPYFAAFLGWVILDEQLAWPAIAGMVITVSGVLIVSLETEGQAAKKRFRGLNTTRFRQVLPPGARYDEYNTESHHETAAKQDDDEISTNDSFSFNSLSPPSIGSTSIIPEPTIADLKTGYVLCIVNVMLDTLGAVVTRLYGTHMTVWEIGLIRFGFCSFASLIVSFFCYLHVWTSNYIMGTSGSSPSDNRSQGGDDINHKRGADGSQGTAPGSDGDQDSLGKPAPLEEPVDEIEACRKPKREPKKKKKVDPWYAFPYHSMTWKGWRHTASGVILSTFIYPALYNYALFKVPLALMLTLASLGPVYSLPLSFLMKFEKPTVRAGLGAVCAVSGIVVLAFWGTPEEE